MKTWPFENDIATVSPSKTAEHADSLCLDWQDSLSVFAGKGEVGRQSQASYSASRDSALGRGRTGITLSSRRSSDGNQEVRKGLTASDLITLRV